MRKLWFYSAVAPLLMVSLTWAQAPDLAQQPQAAGAKGDQQRHYFFAAAGKEMPYRLYVRSYDPSVAAPLIVALHGYGGDQNYFFASVKNLPALCEQYGVIFAAPTTLKVFEFLTNQRKVR